MLATTVLGFAIGIMILVLVRRDQMHGTHAVWWVCVALAIILLGVFPGIVDAIGKELGIFYPPILILVIAVCLLFIKALTIDVERARQEVLLRRLAQRLAVMEKLQQKDLDGQD